MQYRPLGQSGIEASIIGFGAWAIGGWMWGGTDENESIAAIHAALDAGITLIDTAPIYGFGRSEELVGKALAGRRHQVVLATKCGLRWDQQLGRFYFHADEKGRTAQPAEKKVYKYLGADSIRTEVEQSLKRLGTDYIDLYQTHWQDDTTPIDETMTTLLELKQQGKIRAIGVSNATTDHIEQYRRVGPIDTDQERFSMLDRHIEADLLPYCRRHNLALLAYSPLEQGLLTGKITPERRFGPGDQRRYKPQFQPDNLRRVDTLLASLRPIAADHGITLTQLALAWTVAQPGLTHALGGGRTARQATENAAAADVTLTGAELAAIEQAVQAYHRATPG